MPPFRKMLLALPAIGLFSRAFGSAMVKREPAYQNLEIERPAYLRTLRKRADGDTTDQINANIKYLDSVLFAIQIIQSNSEASSWCSDFWLNAFNNMGYDGDYVEAFVCASASGAVLFDGQTLDQARDNLFIALRGLTLARDEPESPARAIDCDYLDLSTLLEAELNGRQIIDLVCYPFSTTTSSSSTMSSTSSTISIPTSGPPPKITTSSSSSFSITGTGISIIGTGTIGTGVPTCVSGYGTVSGAIYCDPGTNTTWYGPSYFTPPPYTPPSY